MRCLVDGISHQGEGVARINGKAVFIPHALPGEELEIEIVEERSRYSRGRIAGIYESSPERTATRCPHYYDCGGCAYQHVEYSPSTGFTSLSIWPIRSRLSRTTWRLSSSSRLYSTC